MIIFDIIASVVLMYMFFKVIQAIVTPFVIAILSVIYKSCGKKKEFEEMLATYKQRNFASDSRQRKSRINPGSGLLMMGNSNIDIGGNAYGTNNMNKR